ncbi:MAG: hypothetical protein ACRD1K_07665 [Acidimicrobiales bacterium]
MGSPSTVDVQRAFRVSILVSAARCLLTYVLLPFVAPAIGLAPGVGPWIGIPLSLVAVAANVLAIRRYFLAAHRRRWVFSAMNLAVLVLLAVLIAKDVAELAR